MTKTNKISDKLATVNESFTINMYDNGFMLEISGKTKKDEWKTTKLMVSTIDDLVELVKEAASLEKDS